MTEMTRILDEYETLAIRECKSKAPSIRKLRKIWKIRCWHEKSINSNYYDNLIAQFLLEIVFNFNLVQKDRITNFILDFDSEEQFRFRTLGADDSFRSNVIRTCVSTIRLSKIDSYGEFHEGLKWRIKAKERADEKDQVLREVPEMS